MSFVDYIDCLLAEFLGALNAEEAATNSTFEAWAGTLLELEEPSVRRMCSHDSDSGGNLEGFLVGTEGDIGLLLTIGSHEGVNSDNLDLVEFLAGFLDSGLLGSTVTDEDEGVVVFNGLDGRLRGERVLDDGVGVEDVSVVLNTSTESDGSLSLGLGDGSSEGSVGPDLSLEVGVRSLLDLLGSGFGLTYMKDGLVTLLPTIFIYEKPERKVSAAFA